MAKTTTVKASGLFLGPNDLGSIPEGALSAADNVVIRRDNIIELRRGMYAVSAKVQKKLKSWKGVLIGHDGSTGLSRSNAAVDAWTDYVEAVDVPSGERVEMVEGGGNLYITTNDFPRRLDALAGPVELHSIPPCGFAHGLLAASGGTALPPGYTVSCRVVFGKYDANDRLILGKPSGRALVVNTDAVDTYDLSCEYAIPPNLPAGTFARLYRTESVENGIDPGDEHGLVLEEEVIQPADSSNFTRTLGSTVVITFGSPHGWAVGKGLVIRFDPDVTGPPLFAAGAYDAIVTGASTIEYTDAGANGSVDAVRTITPVMASFGCVVAGTDLDSTPDGYLGAALYTNPSQGRGIADAAEPIYGARHLETYQGAMFFGDITYPSKCDLYLLSVGGAGGLQLGDTITINGTVFTAIAGGLAWAYGTFVLYTTGTPSENIAKTMESLTGAVNTTREAGTSARAESGPDDVPGYAVIQNDNITATATVTVSRPTAWIIQNLKAPEHIANEVRWSLSQRPDMTPLVDYARVGNQGSAVKRMIATRNALFIFKEDGLYMLRGTVSPWTIELLDPSVILTCPESAVVLDNQVYCLTTRGVIRCSENGVTLLSRPIEPALEDLDPDDVEDYAFGVGYEEDHAYMLWIPTSGSPFQAEEAYVYDVYTDSWVRRTDAAAHGVVHERKLYLASGNYVKAERKLWTTAGDQDYELADDSFAVTITVGGTLVTEVTLASATNVLVGDALVQSTSFAIVIAKVGNVLTLDRAQTWTAAAATSYRAISALVQWSPRLGGDPSAQHRFIEIALLFRSLYFAAAEIGLSSAHDPSWTTIELIGSSYGWTGAQVVKFALRALVDRQHAVSTQLDVAYAVAQALTPWRIQGLSVKYRDIGDRTSK
jgi:hypothetical protein